MDKIPYFDAHCDTISRCVETGEDFTGEDREFYAVPCSLRRSEGHIDLDVAEVYTDTAHSAAATRIEYLEDAF